MKTKEYCTPLPANIAVQKNLRAHYRDRITRCTPEQKQRIENALSSFDMAIEAMERLEPAFLVGNECPDCRRVFTADEMTTQKIYYCPHCGKALLDWVDTEDLT